MRRLILAISVVAATLPLRAEQPVVRVEPTNLQGPRVLNDQTKSTVIRNYLEAWQSVSAALQQNRADLLDRDFVGTAKDKLIDTIHDQVTMGISTRYLDQTHDLQIVFYSPEGLSIQLVDNVEYEVQVLDHGKLQTTQKARGRYVVVMTPAEVRWRVRVFQGGPE
ncbi:MAG TPA: hypothetical protein VFE27_07885 [Acidobacteriaceae bacterium]|jgi:hypothetical protein|nr:hypothetical protein [Acidobacteriaceae bacterium]